MLFGVTTGHNRCVHNDQSSAQNLWLLSAILPLMVFSYLFLKTGAGLVIDISAMTTLNSRLLSTITGCKFVNNTAVWAGALVLNAGQTQLIDRCVTNVTPS